MKDSKGDFPSPGRPLRVAFDHRIFINQRHGGISRHFARIAAHMPHLGMTPKIIAPFYQGDYLRDLPSSMVWGRQIGSAPQARPYRYNRG
jgi:hypothetical protein